jgi:hypothetical protein
MFVIGIDVGGTFTDVTAVDEATGRITITKVPSRPRDEAGAVLAGLDALALREAGVRRLVHGTTVGTNAVLERRGARVALLTTEGFRDLLEIGRTKRNIPALFVPTFVRPKPVVPRALRFEVAERRLHDGRVLRPLDVESAMRAIDALAAAGAKAVAVCLLHAWADPAHERVLGEALKARLPHTPVSLSSDVVPEYREFERFSTTVLNAYLQPLMDRYLAALEERLRFRAAAREGPRGRRRRRDHRGSRRHVAAVGRADERRAGERRAGDGADRRVHDRQVVPRSGRRHHVALGERARVERTALRVDSSGHGRWRGGLGLTREVRLLEPGAQLSVLAERSLLRPYGVCGGGSGAPNRFWVRRGTREVEPSPVPGKVSAFPLLADDIVVMESSGGGGYGDPLARDPAMVAADVAEGMVTEETARDVYGVVAGDAAATDARRRALRAARVRVTLRSAPDVRDDPTRSITLDATSAAALGVAVQDVVEAVNERGAPTRLWVAAITPGATVSPDTLATVGGAPVELRRVYAAPR